MSFGVRTPLTLPVDATASLLQAQPNSVVKEALDKKEKMMVSVGARLIEERSIRRTATESDIEDQAYHSILGHIAQNTADAMTQALRHVSRFYTQDHTPDNDVLYEFVTDFSAASSSAEHRRLLLEEFIAGVISFDEYRNALQQYNQTITLTAEQAMAQIKGDLPFRKELLENAQPTPVGSDNRTTPTTS